MFYQSEIVKFYPAAEPSGVLVPNVQSVSTAFQVQRNDVMRLGRFAPAKHRLANQDPLINVSLDFIPTGSSILGTLGLKGSSSMIDDLASGNYKTLDMKIQIRELIGGGSSVGTFNLTSGVLTNYSFQASVGQTPRTTVSMEFLDMGMDASTAVVPPDEGDSYPVMRPQDIDISLPPDMFGVAEFHPQSFTINLPLNRTPITRIGSRKPISRELSSPVIATFQIQGYVSSFASTTDVSGNSMYNLTCGVPMTGNIGVNILQPTCSGVGSTSLANYTLRYPYLDNVNFSNSVGGYTSVDLQFSCPVTFDNIANESNVTVT